MEDESGEIDVVEAVGEESPSDADNADNADTATSAPVESPTRVLVIGDSIAAQIGWTLYEWGLANPGRIVVFNESHLGCGVVRYGEKRVNETDVGPVGDVCSNWAVPVAPGVVAETETVSWPTALEVFQPDIVIGTVSSWDISDRIVPGVADDWVSIGDPAFDAYVRAEYAAATDVLTQTGAELFWLLSHYLNRDLLPDDHELRVDGINELVVEAVASFPDRDVGFLDYPGWIGPVGGDRDVELRDDGVHLSEIGFAEIARWLVGELGIT